MEGVQAHEMTGEQYDSSPRFGKTENRKQSSTFYALCQEASKEKAKATKR